MAKQAGTTKKPMTRAQLAVTLAVAILVMIGANLVLFLSTPSTRTTSDRTALFGVKKIVVEGNTRYKEESIIGKSGIRIGDSVSRWINNRPPRISAALLPTPKR